MSTRPSSRQDTFSSHYLTLPGNHPPSDEELMMTTGGSNQLFRSDSGFYFSELVKLSSTDSGNSSLLFNEVNDQPMLERAGSFRRSFQRTSPRPSLRNELHVASSSPFDHQLTTVRSNHEDLLYELEPTGPADRTFKIVFTGDAAVGKSSFISRLHDGYFDGSSTATLGISSHKYEGDNGRIIVLSSSVLWIEVTGVDYKVKSIRVDERNVAVQLWDTAGKI